MYIFIDSNMMVQVWISSWNEGVLSHPLMTKNAFLCRLISDKLKAELDHENNKASSADATKDRTKMLD